MGLEQKKEVMEFMDWMCRDLLMNYSWKNAQDYLRLLENSMEYCCIGKESFIVTLDPNFFTQNYERVKDIFPITAKRLRNRMHKDCTIYCGEYSLALPGFTMDKGVRHI